ncbi:hypothetical protein L1080_027690 [Rhodococcus sp. MSC1_016]|nr:hypothetical protein [Rhodococcus sp. MSC1_016]
MTTSIPTPTKRELAEASMRRSWFPVARLCDLDKPQTAHASRRQPGDLP